MCISRDNFLNQKREYKQNMRNQQNDIQQSDSIPNKKVNYQQTDFFWLFI